MSETEEQIEQVEEVTEEAEAEQPEEEQPEEEQPEEEAEAEEQPEEPETEEETEEQPEEPNAEEVEAEEAFEPVEYSADEVESLVLQLREEGLKPSRIGNQLRDEYGVYSTKEVTGKKITEILAENDKSLDLPEDLHSLIVKAAKLREHREENPKDMTAKQGLQKTEDHVRSLAKYYKENERLPQDWKYDPENVNLFLD
jgi:small subunit ribosomal protein S15